MERVSVRRVDIDHRDFAGALLQQHTHLGEAEILLEDGLAALRLEAGEDDRRSMAHREPPARG